MIGKVIFPRPDGDQDGPPPSLTMTTPGVFEAQGFAGKSGQAAIWLAQDAYADFPDGPSMGRPGAAFLVEFARRVGGTAEITPDDSDDPPGRVY